MAVEDSPNGILSAYAAGCKAVLIPDLTGVTKQLKPCLFDVVETLADLRKPIEKCLQA